MRSRPSTLALAVAALVLAAPVLRAEDGPAEKRLADVIALLNGEKKPIDETFAPSFLGQVPEPKLVAIFVDYHKQGGKALGGHLLPAKEKASALAHREFEIEFEKGTLQGWITVEEKAPNKISGLFFKLIEPKIADFDALAKELKKLPGKVSFAAARLGDDSPKMLASLQPDEPLAIGSAFKLYVLGALLLDVCDGKSHHWADVVSLREDRKSLPSGILQSWPASSPVTIETLATLMISISDNTATDHLLLELGRERVEKELAALGNQHAERSIPFLTTGDLFRIKWGKPGLVDEWVKANLAGKRAILADLDKVPLPDVSKIEGAEPTRISEIEWFASGSDLVRALDGIRKLTDSGPAAAGRAILAVNPGLELKKWKYVGFKGGSEPGVLELTWLLEREDGAWFALALGWNDPDDEVDKTKFLGLAGKAAELVRATP
jgi:hypothetical protein